MDDILSMFEEVWMWPVIVKEVKPLLRLMLHVHPEQRPSSTEVINSLSTALPAEVLNIDNELPTGLLPCTIISM